MAAMLCEQILVSVPEEDPLLGTFSNGRLPYLLCTFRELQTGERGFTHDATHLRIKPLYLSVFRRHALHFLR